MSDRSIWQGIGDIIGGNGSKGRGKALTTVEQRCPVCLNALDPRWTKCPYCEAARNAGNQSTRIVSEPAAAPAEAPSRRVTRVDMDETDIDTDTRAASAPPAGNGGGGRRPTMVEPESDTGSGAERQPLGGRSGAGGGGGGGGGRRITGIVTTFTWSRLGQLHIVRDGRNYAGSGVVSSDNNAPCEILVPDDGTMSSAHFLILCQGGKYIVSDNFSTNGTFVNGVQIDTRGVELGDDAVIKAGATVFRFQKIVAVAGAAEPPKTASQGPATSHGEDYVP